MPVFAANLSMLFTEADFMDRFRLAREAGFTGVEYLFPYEWPASGQVHWMSRWRGKPWWTM